MNNLRGPFYAVVIICVVLIFINFQLNSKLTLLEEKNSNLIDEYLDLKAQHDLIFDETLRLEEENQILGSAAAANETK